MSNTPHRVRGYAVGNTGQERAISLNARDSFAHVLLNLSLSVVGSFLILAVLVPATAIADNGLPALKAQVDRLQQAIQVLQTQNATLSARVTELQAKLSKLLPLQPLASYITVETSPINGLVGPHIIITGANVHIRNGNGPLSSLTAASGCPASGLCDGSGLAPYVNGRGNLVIGYNELEPPPYRTQARTGSHNLIIGYGHEFTGNGGLVGGILNSVAGASNSVTGGFQNIASGLATSVSGGAGNTASVQETSVTGGVNNIASGYRAAVCGGQNNTASGQSAVVSGGIDNVASGFGASVSGGQNNVASQNASSVSGGHSNVASGDASAVSGGNSVVEENAVGWSAGGDFHNP